MPVEAHVAWHAGNSAAHHMNRWDCPCLPHDLNTSHHFVAGCCQSACAAPLASLPDLPPPPPVSHTLPHALQPPPPMFVCPSSSPLLNPPQGYIQMRTLNTSRGLNAFIEFDTVENATACHSTKQV